MKPASQQHRKLREAQQVCLLAVFRQWQWAVSELIGSSFVLVLQR